MKNITILLPIHQIGEDDPIMLANALTSIEDFYNDIKLTIICPSNIKKELENFDFGQKLEVKLLENKTSNTDFVNQINIGIDDCDTEWFSIMEIDDTYKKGWLKSMNLYTKEYPENDIFLPVVRDINDQGNFLTFTNESAWAFGFTEKQGFIDNEVLMEYQNYQTSGGLFRTKKIIDIGKFKDNIKLVFSYEFLLRATHFGLTIMVVPKIGYEHLNFRKNSLFWLYKNDETQKLTEKEVKFWIETAKTEFFHKNKREVTYVEN
jgi:hypothetical protein